MTKRKSKGKRGSTADFEFGEWPFLDGVPSADAEDAARYRYMRALALKPGGSLEAFVALNQLDHCCGDMAMFDGKVDAAMRGE